MNIHPESSKPVVVCAFGLLAAFFMPWVQIMGFGMTGYNLGRLGSYGNYAWVIPILAGSTILLSFAGIKNRLIGAIAGIVPLAAILYGLVRISEEGGRNATNGALDMAQVLSIGAWLTVIFSIAILIAARRGMSTTAGRGLDPPYVLLTLGAALLLFGSYRGLFVAPPEQYMRDVQRIMYVHVPTAWNWMLVVLFSLFCAIAFLFRNNMKWDSRLEAGLEVGTLMAFLLCCQGSIWAKPTWGVWWDWDPRLTSTAVLLFATLGILALRNFVEDPVKRATWSAVATIIASVDLPIIYYSVKWWNSLHQEQSTPQTVSSPFHLPLRVNAFGVLFLMIGFIMLRTRIAAARLERDLAEPRTQIGEEAGELA